MNKRLKTMTPHTQTDGISELPRHAQEMAQGILFFSLDLIKLIHSYAPTPLNPQQICNFFTQSTKEAREDPSEPEIGFFHCVLKPQPVDLYMRSITMTEKFQSSILEHATGLPTRFRRCGFQIHFHSEHIEPSKNMKNQLIGCDGLLCPSNTSAEIQIHNESWITINHGQRIIHIIIRSAQMQQEKFYLTFNFTVHEEDDILFFNPGQSESDAVALKPQHLLYAFLQFVGVMNVQEISACSKNGFVLNDGRFKLTLEDGWADLNIE